MENVIIITDQYWFENDEEKRLIYAWLFAQKFEEYKKNCPDPIACIAAVEEVIRNIKYA